MKFRETNLKNDSTAIMILTSDHLLPQSEDSTVKVTFLISNICCFHSDLIGWMSWSSDMIGWLAWSSNLIGWLLWLVLKARYVFHTRATRFTTLNNNQYIGQSEQYYVIFGRRMIRNIPRNIKSF